MHYYQIEFGTPEYDEAVKLRYNVLREPLGLDFSAEDLAQEFNHFHLGAYHDQGHLIGYLLLSPKGEKVIQMRQVAVEPQHQHKGIGRGLVIFSEEFIKRHGFSEMVLHARDSAVPFYEKLNYKKAGVPFEEVGIKHYKMVKKV
ncbi:MAG: GNAT family N-acetyltransferase [Saprospiraceae bacterium]|nr:GNAT family N-acetyltransferase [Saprospiraceae bacterium]